jgi:hypothetical protein
LIGTKELSYEVNDIVSNIECKKIIGIAITAEGDIYVPPTFSLHNNDCSCKSCNLKESDYALADDTEMAKLLNAGLMPYTWLIKEKGTQ